MSKQLNILKYLMFNKKKTISTIKTINKAIHHMIVLIVYIVVLKKSAAATIQSFI